MKARTQFTALLNRAHGYAAHAQRRVPVRRAQGIAQRAQNLAQAIIARYAALERRWPGMAMVLEEPRHEAGSETHAYHTTHPSIFINPRVLLRMLVSQRVPEPRVAAERTMDRQERTAAPMTYAAAQRQDQTPLRGEDVMERIVRRAVRHESVLAANGKPSDGTPVRIAQIAAVEKGTRERLPSLARVYRRTPQASADTPSVAPVARSEQGKIVQGSWRDANAKAAIQAPVDITRITDQVLQALDKRIVAQRERMGKI